MKDTYMFRTILRILPTVIVVLLCTSHVKAQTADNTNLPNAHQTDEETIGQYHVALREARDLGVSPETVREADSHKRLSDYLGLVLSLPGTVVGSEGFAGPKATINAVEKSRKLLSAGERSIAVKYLSEILAHAGDSEKPVQISLLLARVQGRTDIAEEIATFLKSIEEEIRLLSGGEEDGDWIEIGRRNRKDFKGDTFIPPGTDYTSGKCPTRLSAADERLSLRFYVHGVRGTGFGDTLKAHWGSLKAYPPSPHELKTVLDPIINRFLLKDGRAGQEMSYDSTTSLAKLILTSATYADFKRLLSSELSTKVGSATPQNFDWSMVNIDAFLDKGPPGAKFANHFNFDVTSENFVLFAVIGGTQATQVFVRASKDDHSRADIKVILWDVYGLEYAPLPSMKLYPLRGMWELQHMTKNAKPFIQKVEVVDSIVLKP